MPSSRAEMGGRVKEEPEFWRESRGEEVCEEDW